MNENKWVFSVSLGGKTANVTWAERFYEGASAGYWLSVDDPETGERFTDFDELFTDSGVKEVALAYQHPQISLEKKFVFETD